MDSRRLLAHQVLVDGVEMSKACRDAGVSRPTGYLWVNRAREEGLAQLRERSRRPAGVPRRTPEALEEELLAMKSLWPGFGPKKLCAKMDGRLHPRTAARILARSGLNATCSPSTPEAPVRFERSSCNELWQADFKGLNRRARSYEILSVIDDAARFCVCLRAVSDLSLHSAWEALWAAFGEYGLPEAVLTDNGSAFSGGWAKTLSTFDARLLQLGIRPIHGRPYHPQTQGKVERFHGTLEKDLGKDLLQPSLILAQQVVDPWRQIYNWERPHEALGQKVPASLYRASPRQRPARLPEPEYQVGTQVRKVDSSGFFTYKGQNYCAGKGLIGQKLGLIVAEEDVHVLFCNYDLGPLTLFRQKV